MTGIYVGQSPASSISIDALQEKIRTDTDSGARDRDRLLLAGKLFGRGDLRSAERIYSELLADSGVLSVIDSATENLETTRQCLEIRDETDPRRKDRLKMELAIRHGELGHDLASERLLHDLRKSPFADIAARAEEMLTRESSRE